MEEEAEKAKASLERIQKFEVSSLPREKELGVVWSFKDAVGSAQKTIDLFSEIPTSILPKVSNSQRNTIVKSADGFYQLLTKILEFDPKQPEASAQRTNLIESVESQFETYFNNLSPIIAYAASKQQDFSVLARDFRASIQQSQDAANEVLEEIKKLKESGQEMLTELRKVAAEQGVSQEAIYFKTESDAHEDAAVNWRIATICLAVGLTFYAIASIFLHKWEWLTPQDTYQTTQLVVSKVLIFSVLAYMLILCARNFLSHKHNAIVNRHRQNALLTFNALAAAANSDDRRDIVLSYAASCIFSPQDTGYTKASSGGASDSSTGIIQALPKIISTTSHS